MKVIRARLNEYSIHACTVKYIQNQMNRDLSGHCSAYSNIPI